MMRAATLALFGPLLLALLSGGAFAASAPQDAAEEDEPNFLSAARGGTFSEIPPSGNGFPADLLAAMRRKLGGERPVPDAPQPPDASDGH